MLTDKNTGIPKFILDPICRIHEELVKDDLEFRELGEKPDER